ncbi:uncharacterized protein RJT21DRAFT_12247 [Scheffersomyces amazonensis]|uniref:uncharacterized protein n=1 Tax=Scheffersomyces amazonensis TaxID=1078765 RepID=UPI00315C8A0B
MSIPFVRGPFTGGFTAFYNGLFPAKPSFTEQDYPKLDGKVIIVTGATSGVGFEVAKLLLGTTDAKVYIFSRNKEKTENAIKKLETEIATEYSKKHLNIGSILIDFADLDTIKPAAEKFLQQEDRLDIIIHNAGVMQPPDGSKTKQGYELQLGSNALGPHLLQKFLDPLLIKTSQTNEPGKSRIIWVASTAHYFSPLGGVNWADINFENTTGAYAIHKYGQSKALGILQSRGWHAAHPEGSKITSVSLCPGFLNTELQRYGSSIEKYLGSWLLSPAKFGAYTELFAALSPEVKTGDYIQSFGNVVTARSDLSKPEYIGKAWKYLDEEVESYL